MLRTRRFIVNLLNLIFIIGLVGLAVSISLKSAFTEPAKLKTWVGQSGFYASTVNKASGDINETLLKTGAKISPNLKQEINRSIVSALPKTQFTSDVNTVIDSNYAWLKGQTATPTFSISLSSQKSSIANTLGNYLAGQYSGLPTCSLGQAEIEAFAVNPFDATCKVTSVSQTSVKTAAINVINSSRIVTNSTKITADSIKKPNTDQPYYKNFNGHRAYSLLREAPIIFGSITIICLIGIVAIPTKKRKLTRLSISFAAAGLLLVIAGILKRANYSRIDTHIANQSSLSGFVSPTINLAHKAIEYLAGINLHVGLVYLGLALILLIAALIHHKWHKHVRTNNVNPALEQPINTRDQAPRSVEAQLSPITDEPIIKPEHQPTAPLLGGKPSGVKHSHLIQ